MAEARNDKTTFKERRLGPENSAMRLALLEAAEEVISEEGYAAATSRRVAEKAGVKQQLVYYYFLTMDDLLLATFRHTTDRLLKSLQAVLASDEPLHGLLKLMTNPTRSNIYMEYMALGNHNEAVRAEIVKYTEHVRRMLAKTLSTRLKPWPEGSSISSPMLAVYLVHTIPQILHYDIALGMSVGHREVRAYLRKLVDELEPSTSRKAGRTATGAPRAGSSVAERRRRTS
jgi:AcrR family transcriptional regulator